jgi:Cation transport ATPase
MESIGITPKACEENLSCVYVAVDGKLEGTLYFKQKIDENALEAIKRLKDMGYKVGLISGDERAFVEEFSNIFDEVYWSLKPQDKQKVVMDKKSKGAKIMYVGDGINDALAMAISDVSVAVANASGVARISASILLFNKNLKAIPWIIKFSNNVKKIIYTNFIWASVYNTFGIALAMAGLIQPIWSAVFMIISSVSVVYNSSRIENM